MNSDQSKKRKKYRKKHLDHGKSLTYRNPDKSNEDVKLFLLKRKPFKPKEKSRVNVSKNRKISVLPKRKTSKNTSTFISKAGNSANTNHNKISTVPNIKKKAKSISEEAVSISSMDAKKLVKSKKNIVNKNNEDLKNKLCESNIPKNSECKKKRKHLYSSDESFSFPKNLKRKKVMSSANDMITNNFKIKNKTSVKKYSVLQKTETEDSNESDSNEDEILRNELNSFSVYKNIQKLLKENPSVAASTFIGEKSADFEELSIKCVDISNDKSEILPSSISISTSNKINKALLKKGFDGTEAYKDEKIVAMATETSTGDFQRTKKNTQTNQDKKVVSQKEAYTLKNKALEKLQAAKFRYLNEKLYTESGKDSFEYFQRNTDEYMDYHKGYSLQVAKWPLNPVEKIISSLQKMKKNLTIADMGCGDAKVARTLSNYLVHSFDLVALNDFVTPCNISKVPLLNESVEVVIFCLSLMGTNLEEYLQEAYRITKFGGLLKIAEVESRIPNLDQFIKSIQSIGFSLQKKDVEHKLFVFLDFEKIKRKKKCAKLQDITLKPCLYKKR